MPTDKYMKVILTVIALALVTIACNQVSSPPTTVHAEGPFANVIVSGVAGSFIAMNSRTGEIWEYTESGGHHVHFAGKLVELGKPLSQDH